MPAIGFAICVVALWAGLLFPACSRAADRVVRPAVKRVEYDDARLSELGIRRFESKRLRLFTDIDPEKAKGLPGLVDQVYVAWTGYFGELPPAADRGVSDHRLPDEGS